MGKTKVTGQNSLFMHFVQYGSEFDKLDFFLILV